MQTVTQEPRSGAWVFEDGNILNIILRLVGACVVGFIMSIGLGIVLFCITLVLKVLRFVFWNAWTLLLAIMIVIGIWSYAAFGHESTSYGRSERSESVTSPVHNMYRCTANVLNVRALPSKNSRVVGTLRRNQEVEVMDVEKGFAIINFNGQRSYVSIDYLTKIN